MLQTLDLEPLEPAGSAEASPGIEMVVQQTPWDSAVNTVVNSSEDRDTKPQTF